MAWVEGCTASAPPEPPDSDSARSGSRFCRPITAGSWPPTLLLPLPPTEIAAVGVARP